MSPTPAFEDVFRLPLLLPPESPNGECTLPCWYDLQVETSDRQGVQQAFSQLLDFPSDVDFFKAIPPDAQADQAEDFPNFDVAGYFWHDNYNDGYDDGLIELIAWVEQDSGLLQGLSIVTTTRYVGLTLSVSELVQELGTPSEIQMYVDDSRFSAVVSTFIYVDKGISVKYWQIIPQEWRPSRVYCVDNPVESTITYIVAPAESLDPQQLTPIQIEGLVGNSHPKARPIIDRIGLSPEEFAAAVVSDSGYCLRIPVAITLYPYYFP